jgi:protein phosphatase
VFTRTGRSFFADPAFEQGLLGAVRDAASDAGLWEELSTDWLALDSELLPWSLKAGELVRSQYAGVGAAATAGLGAGVGQLEVALGRGIDVGALLARQRERLAWAKAFVDAYRPYCWSVSTPADVRLAPFQVLAGEEGTYVDREHVWHLGIAERLANASPEVLWPTRSLLVDPTDQASRERGSAWWEELTAAGGEGMVVKPAEPIVRGRRGIVQPGIKVRGREYLRIVYGPEYAAPANLERLRSRALGRKRSLAAREFALGVEALERFSRGEPLHRVHECVFAVLALESEPVDPRL